MKTKTALFLLFWALGSTAAQAENGLDFTRSFVVYDEYNVTYDLQDYARSRLIAHLSVQKENAEPLDFYLGAAMRAHDTFRHLNSGHLFFTPSYQFYLIQGKERMLFGRVGSPLAANSFAFEHTFADAHGITGSTLLRRKKLKALPDAAAIVDASYAGKPLQAQVKYTDHGYSVTLEFPVEFLNADNRKWRMQVNTGPILVPDFSIKSDDMFAKLRRAYIDFDSLDGFELLLEKRDMKGTKKAGYLERAVFKADNITLYVDE